LKTLGFYWGVGVGRSFQLFLGEGEGVDSDTRSERGAFDGVAEEFGGSHVWIVFLWGRGMADQERVADGCHSKSLGVGERREM